MADHAQRIWCELGELGHRVVTLVWRRGLGDGLGMDVMGLFIVIQQKTCKASIVKSVTVP